MKNSQDEDSSKVDAAKVCLSELRNLADQHVGNAISWYKAHVKSPLYFFRITGTLLICLSISLPVVASSPESLISNKNLIVSLMSLAVALLSSIGTFFHWNETWRVNSSSLLELEHLLAIWQVKMIAAEQGNDSLASINAAIKATEELFKEAAKTDKANTEAFFKNVKLPNVKI